MILPYIAVNIVANNSVDLTMYYPIVTLMLNIVIASLVNIVIDLKLKNACKVINNKEVQKFIITKRSKQFETRTWASLVPGDIIKIKENEEFPADVLLLDVNSQTNDHKCYVRGGFIDDFSLPSLKKSCEGTQNKTPGIKMPASQFVDQISGLVKYEYNYNGFFSGSYKLNNNPAAFTLSNENVAVRGSYLCQTKSAICLVLNVGSQCMGSIFKGIQNNNQINSLTKNSLLRNKKNHDQIYNIMRIFQVVMIFIYVVVAFIVLFQAKFQTKSTYYKFLKNIAYLFYEDGNQNSATVFIQQILGFQCNLFASLPLSYKLVMDIIALTHSNFVEWDYNTAPAGLKFNQGISMKVLGNISNLFISKSSIMSHNVKKAKIVQIKRNQYFDMDEDEQRNNQNGFGNIRLPRRNSLNNQTSNFKNYSYPQQYPYRRVVDDSIISYHEQVNVLNPQTSQLEPEENLETIDDYLPNTFNFQASFRNEQLSNDLLYSSTNKDQIFEFMRGLTMCHQAIRRKEPNPKSKCMYKSIFANEQAQLMLAHSYGFEFMAKNNKTITVSCQGTKERYDVIVNFDFLHCDQHITVIVIKPFQTQNSGSQLYVKGPLSSMLEFINEPPHEEQLYLNDLKKYTQMGISPIMIAKKNLTNEETHDLEAKINEAMSLVKGQEEKIETSLLYYMTDLISLGIIGIQEIFNNRDSLTIQDILRNGVKVWMLSKDDEVMQVVNCNAMKLLSANSNPLVINGETEKDVEEQVKGCLKALADGKSSKEKKLRFLRQQTSVNLDECQSSNQSLQDLKNEKKTLIISGLSLKFIFRDEQLLKCFLTVAMFSDFIVGSSVTSAQRADLLKYVRQYSQDGTFSMAVIGAAEDQNLILEADVSVALNVRYQQSDTLITSDIVMNDIYPLTYLLFKHGTQCHRRMHEATKIFLYRTFLIGMIQLYYMSYNGITTSIPFKQLMLLIFMIAVSKFQIILFGISHKDAGFDYFYRIFGEYKRNFVINIFDWYDLLIQFSLAFFDACVFYLISWQNDFLQTIKGGRLLTNDGLQLYYGIMIYVIFTFRLRNYNEVVKTYHFFILIANIIGIMFILDDENLFSIRNLAQCPSALLYMFLVFSICALRNYSFDVMRKLIIPCQKRSFDFYTDVEDKLYLEEYEDPDQEFLLEQFGDDFEDIQKRLANKKISIVNYNLMKIERSDSMDVVIEKLNQLSLGNSLKKFHDSTILNWITLKFNDQNKEIEYLDSRAKDKIQTFRRILVITFIFNGLEMIKQIILSSISILDFEQFYYYMGYTLINLILLFFTYKLQQYINLINFVLISTLAVYYSFCYYYIEALEFTLFMNLIIFTFSMRGTCWRFFSAISLALYILDINLVNAFFTNIFNVKYMNLEYLPSLIFPYLSVIWIYAVLLWIIFVYWEEKARKLEFWFGYKKVKEFQKLKSILHILMPAFVRERIRQGQRFIADDQGEVTILFCDIANFDNIVQMFSGRELCEWLDHIYNAFDQLCEQHALQKIETVGKTYMACGGLKQCEKKFDQRLLNKHHAERITEFAFNIVGFVKTQRLKDGSFVKVKIGIHSGQVISGVVGENKPQFSLVGDTVNKSSRVCGQCQPNRILISKETHKHLENNSNMFYFDHVSAFFKGIGHEDAYYVHKQRGNNILQLQKQKSMLGRRDRSPSLSNPPRENNNKQNNAKFKSTFASGNINRIQPIGRRASGLEQQEAPAPLNGNAQDTSRSFINSERQSENNDPLELLNQSSDDEHFGEDDSFRDYNYLNFGELKDDRQIYKNPVENSQYNLVERPNYLIQFNQNNSQLEHQFLYQQFKQNYWKKIFFFTAYVIFNKLELVFFALQHENLEWQKIFLYVYCPFVVIFEIILYLRFRWLTVETVRMMSYLLGTYFSIMLMITSAQCWDVNHNSRIIQIYIIEIMITVSLILFLGVMQLKQILLVYFVSFISWVVVICLKWDQLTTKTYSFLFEFIYFIVISIFNYHAQEMLKRKVHNRDKIIDIEIKRTSDLLNNLVPPPVLQGIKNDQKVVDELEDVTLLFTDMVKFTNFSNNVKNPKEVVKLLSELFTRFDQLCVSNKVYKVHTIGDCYVIMGYTGHILQSERTKEIKAQEAYKVIQTGFEMIDIIQDVRNHSDNPDLQELNMRIGIHTGKIVAGIIGTKIVRYDIFGADVLIANKMESNGEPGQVVISGDTKKILLDGGDPRFYEQLEFIHHKSVEFEAISKKVEAYLVKPRQAINSSEPNLSFEDDDDDDEDLSEESKEEEEEQQLSRIGHKKLEEIKEEIEIRDENIDNL